ncbi:type II toxin-antitoxin system VapC family toxin [Desulfomarina sp.]
MILVDTSVLIDFFKGNTNRPTNRLREIIRQQIPFGITSVIYQEILQGAASLTEYELLEEYLGSQRFFHPLDPVESYAQAAHIFFTCRQKGITIRSTIDCLIARIAIEHDLFLLHNDRDFTLMAPVIGLNSYI